MADMFAILFMLSMYVGLYIVLYVMLKELRRIRKLAKAILIKITGPTP